MDIVNRLYSIQARILLKLSILFYNKNVDYHKVASTSLSHLKTHAGFFGLSMKGKFDVTFWIFVGNVNIDLDNLSLGGGNNKGKGLPMNALITPTASPQRTQHGSALGMAPPPLKPAGGSLDLGDLLN